MRILVVDDDRNISRLAVKAARFALPGADVRCAEDGREAWALLQVFRPDLLITDLMMPGLDGNQLLRQIKAQSDWGEMRVVVVTALAADDRRVLDAQAAGAWQVVHKPFNLDELEGVLLGSQPGRESPPRFEPRKNESPPPSATAVLATGPLLDMLDQDRALCAEILTTFLQSLGPRLTAIEDAVRCGEPRNCEIAVHGLKGAAITVGAMRLGQLGLALEVLARQERLDAVGGLLNELRTAIAHARQAVETWLTENSSKPM